MENTVGRNRNVPETLSDIASLRSAINNVQAASANVAWLTDFGLGALNTGSFITYAAAVMRVKASGIFEVRHSMRWEGATATDSATFQLLADSNVGGYTFTNAANSGTPTSGQPAAGNHFAGTIFTASAGAGILVASGGTPVDEYISTIQNAVAGSLSGQMTYNVIVNPSGTIPYGFPKNSFVAFLFQVNMPSAWALTPTIIVEERPFGPVA